jgi:hypothetical protein
VAARAAHFGCRGKMRGDPSDLQGTWQVVR